MPSRRRGGLRLPSGSPPWLSFGGLLAFLLLLQIGTGALLLFHFAPDAELAFESVRRIMREVPYGWLIRLLHAHGANLLVIVLFVHLGVVAWRGAYQGARGANWLLGCVLLVLVMAAALTGYILPWSQLSYWGTTVVTASLEYLPVGGHELTTFVRGSERVGPATFRRAFAAHVSLIPLAILGLLALHVAWVRRAGIAGAARRGPGTAEPETMVPFFPEFAIRAGLVLIAGLAALVALVVFAPGAFFPAESFSPADPFETPSHVKPEWYFLWRYQLGRLVPESVALVIQALALAALAALPFLDRGRRRHAFDRPLVIGAL
ncbi:MAG: cytochrome bc complex cytochrome b subunit, partial [Myxococcota bacterium]